MNAVLTMRTEGSRGVRIIGLEGVISSGYTPVHWATDMPFFSPLTTVDRLLGFPEVHRGGKGGGH